MNPRNVYNTLSWAHHEWLKIKGQWIKVAVPAMGYKQLEPVELQAGEERSGALSARTEGLENYILSIQFAEDGTITSIFDKEQQREALSPGLCANRLAVYQDEGDAWDFSIHSFGSKP